jgi:hypothetical protein
MPASTSRSAACLVAMVLLVALVGGCAGQADESTAGAQATTTSTTVAPTTTTVPPMTAEELAWLKAVTKLHDKIDKVFFKEGTVHVTRAVMTSYANTLRACSRELARIGAPSDRLQPVYVLVKKACRTFDKGAKCFDTAIRVSDASGGVTTANLPTFERASECGTEAAGNGSNLLADAEAKGVVIEAQAGR